MTQRNLTISGGGRKLTSEEHEQKVIEQFIHLRAENKAVSATRLIEIGQHFAQQLEVPLECTKGWLRRFLDRNFLKLRAVTSKISHDPIELAYRATEFIKYVRHIIIVKNITPGGIWNCAETAIFCEPNESRTIDFIDQKIVVVKSAGLAKVRLTGIVMANALGVKKTPVIIAQGSGNTTNREEGCFILKRESSGMNGDLFIKYLQLMFPLTSKAAASRMLLIFDSAPAHRSKKVKAYLKERGFNYVLIPGGLTGLLQPADVSWFKPMKATIRNCIEEWLKTAPVTTSNRVRAPLANDMAKWMKESLDKLKSEVISKSFQASFLGPSQTLLISRHPSIRPHLDINSFDALLP
ncbi:hypothetical protein GEMRC1_006752 [Eukaryota sp. GEM-RC1]